MISITAIIKSKTENREQVQNMLHHLVTETRKEAACVRYDLHATKNIFIIWEEWKDQDGLDFHNSQIYLQDFIAKSEDLIDAPIQVYKTAAVL
ncbi:putative quinol monooxygenase [Flavobacterium sp. Fl-77]|uniref:Quinol monooxygenase n=1 Tax=Flavobacterium flavipigmentatum TaxID=2893884 RepID=A0AAJ2VYR7_9FLAO|nr:MULTISPECIES: putative quinol monooxygenase [unclassified Flavobacterium]MDX6183421.1 putative quinol monooxygenase [Flavobacterium sp. Fl-33]MDX6186705.1 putative quinol monooxygenase [Flavobacterium sp. Fl-77]UFH38527.1 antibiotic biosynthesis monooxygenase [Flavobacterium sp. F-70]